MDSFGLFLELNQVGSGMWQMPCPSPTAKNGRGDIDLRPANVAYWADQAGRIVKASHRLVILGAKAPQVTTLAQVLWAGIVEMVFDLVVRRNRGWVPSRCSSVDVVSSPGVPFCRCNYSLRRVLPIPPPLFRSIYVDQGVSDGCVAMFRYLDHHCVLPAEVHICDHHLLAIGVEKAGARAYFPHHYSSGGLEFAARGQA
jgi:hypothetical protein